jgi:hypothetical protein
LIRATLQPFQRCPRLLRQPWLRRAGQVLQEFVRRFFADQFKRSCLPDGPKVGSVSLSPRGDWRMPPDAQAALWQRWLEQHQP